MDKSQIKLVKLKFLKWIFIEFTGKNTLITRLLLLLSGVSDCLLCLTHLSECSFYPSNLTLALLRSLALQALAHSPCLAHTFLLRCLLSVHRPISVFANFVSLGLGSYSIGAQ